MNNNDKILLSLTAGMAIGAILGILLTKEKTCECASKTPSKKIVKDILEGFGKKDSNEPTFEEEIGQVVKEVFAENPKEYA